MSMPLQDLNGNTHIFELLISEAQRILICGGDFNVRLQPTLDSLKPCLSGEKKTTKKHKMNVG